MTRQVMLHAIQREVRQVILLLVWLSYLAPGQSRDKAIVAGRVENESGEPMDCANVLIVGTLDGDVSGPKQNDRAEDIDLETPKQSPRHSGSAHLL